MIPFTVGINEEYLKIHNIDVNNITNQDKSKINYVTAMIVLTYIGNSLVIIFFGIYIFLAARKVKVGYLFYISWIIIFAALTGMPFINGIAVLQPMQLGIGIAISIICVAVIIGLFISSFLYFAERKRHHYEWVRIHKGK
ncbi:hypothetical protein [Mycoplasma buteonis]|uniref:hypothetical protein n=1 Tax=Mycoplasma buteonis TaxID=171280 RepID=UPI0012EB1CC2|nr:hypothetical protein [Mycoplasma buteonis]